jgi:hypothetical protein
MGLTCPSTQRLTYQELRNAYLALNLWHQEVLAEMGQRNGFLGERIIECMRLIHELSLLHQEEDRIRLQQDIIAHTAGQAGQPLNPYDTFCEPPDFVAPSGPGIFNDGHPAHTERITARDLWVRQLGQAFYRDPSLTSSSFNGAWQSVSTS